MSDADQERKELRNRLARLEDQIEHVLQPTLEEQAEEISEKEQRIDELEATVDGLQSRLDSIIDVDDKADSNPQNRAVALREAMVRAARDRVEDGGVTWWWKEVRDQLASHGHSGFSKPTYHSTMDDAADKDGFRMATKDVVSGGQTREVKAVQVVPSKLTDPHLRNQFTTRDASQSNNEAASTSD